MQKESHLAYLDGIRGGAALWVMLAHCMIWGGWRWYVPDPKIAVDIFMVMSGFLMNYHYILRTKNNGPWDTQLALSFYLRRFFRIAPCYYLALLVAFYILGENRIESVNILREANPARWTNDIIYDPKCWDLSISNLIRHLTFIFGLYPRYTQSLGLPDWSISLEMQFYLLFPFMFFFLRRNYAAVIITVTVLSLAVNSLFGKLPGPYPGTSGLFPEPSFFFSKSTLFLVGIMLCDSIYRDDLRPGVRPIVGSAAIAIAGIGLRDNRLELIVVLLALWVIIVNSELRSTSLSMFSKVLLGNRLTKFLADTSYAVYLFHGFAISELGARLFMSRWFTNCSSLLQVLVLSLGVTFLTYPIAYLIHRTVEVPFISFGKRLSKISIPIKATDLSSTAK